VKNANPIDLPRLLRGGGERPGEKQDGNGSGDDRPAQAPVSKPIAHELPQDLKPTARIVMVWHSLCST
jgi:hypothetical protein